MRLNNENQGLIKKWELLFGIIFISLLGSFLHFTYELSGNNLVIASFSAVNESVWEHLKLVFFPLLIFSAIEYRFIKEESNNIPLAKFVAGYTMPLTIVLIFYSYELVTGTHNFIIDISSFFISVVVGQYLSYKLLIIEEKSSILQLISIILIIILAMIFIIFTFYPPHIFLFREYGTGTYGIG